MGDSTLSKYQGFFSYAHSDAKAEPELVAALTEQLELRVSNKLINASFGIWRDVKGIRTGDLWNQTIEDAVRASDVMILLLSPKWIESENCKKEYLTFLQVESGRQVGEYIAPLLVRDMSSQRKHLSVEQGVILVDLEQRQYTKVIAESFLELDNNGRALLIDRIADDVVGMIDRLRLVSDQNLEMTTRSRRQIARGKEFSAKARNFEEVDFVDRPEIELQELESGDHALVGQFDFVDRLYVQSKRARIEFGIARAYITVRDPDGGVIERSDHLKNGSPHVRYVTLRDEQNALVVSVDPPQDRRSLGELALPPGPKTGENRLAEIGIVPASCSAELTAELSVSLCVEGLSLTEGSAPSNAARRAIEAIAAVAAAKEKDAKDGKMRRSVKIKKQKK